MTGGGGGRSGRAFRPVSQVSPPKSAGRKAAGTAAAPRPSPAGRPPRGLPPGAPPPRALPPPPPAHGGHLGRGTEPARGRRRRESRRTPPRCPSTAFSQRSSLRLGEGRRAWTSSRASWRPPRGGHGGPRPGARTESRRGPRRPRASPRATAPRLAPRLRRPSLHSQHLPLEGTDSAGRAGPGVAGQVVAWRPRGCRDPGRPSTHSRSGAGTWPARPSPPPPWRCAGPGPAGSWAWARPFLFLPHRVWRGAEPRLLALSLSPPRPPPPPSSAAEAGR